jgi:hypothetical protein
MFDPFFLVASFIGHLLGRPAGPRVRTRALAGL